MYARLIHYGFFKGAVEYIRLNTSLRSVGHLHKLSYRLLALGHGRGDLEEAKVSESSKTFST